ncbi:MAG: SusD/RagB family nutrient-binding outer membrane lipoprotein [Chitinophagaceae bacterium]|nr:SusD/RagB family nutrient-binding outer membrane lipoprotein [Chitinophagaceae bacterium]
MNRLYNSAMAAVLISSLLATSGCTKKFDAINTDPTTFSALPPATIPKAFARSQWEGVFADPGNYEVIHSLYTDLWSQYFVDAGGFPGDRYVLDQNLVIFSWNLTYTINWPSLKLVIDATEKTAPSANAIAKIWKVYLFHQQSDLYGPIPYFQAGLGQLSIPYDPQEALYNNFFSLLDSALTTLKTSDTAQAPFGTDDLIYHGNIGKWLKFGNTLRLRLALRISEIDPAKAQVEAEKSIAAGVMTGNADNAFVDVGPNSINGLAAEAPWENMRMSASMLSYLKGFSDPRMTEYYSPADDDGQYHGIRNGMTPSQLSVAATKNGTNLSNINTTRWSDLTQATTPLNVMYSAEAYFLRAEAALNGWNAGGSAKDLYEQGIATSLQQWGITDDAAIQQYVNGTSLPAAPGDYLNSPAVAQVAVKFASDEATQRQQIITQKWLALFPDGIEAWAELRRTGFPVLYPVVNSDNPDVSASDIIRRFTFQSYEYQTNAKAVQDAIKLLNGPDKASTRVWWNK